ncbi:MAG: DUF4364 family protein [Clostridia bacterium]|nr:DUF4364 family protein [Clostridia bacterium]
MPKLQGLLTEKNDVKVFILFLMANVGYPLKYDEVHDITVQNDYVGYCDFSECFAELLEDGHIVESSADGTDVYSVSELGKKVSNQLETEIRPVIREKSLRSALRMLSFRKMGATLRCDTKQLPDGRYRFSCAIEGKDGDLMNAQIVTDSEQLCVKMDNNFREKPDIIFRGMISLLSGDVNYLLE